MNWKTHLAQSPPSEWESLFKELEEDINEIYEILEEEKKHQALMNLTLKIYLNLII